MDTQQVLAAHGIGVGKYRKNSLIPLGDAAIVTNKAAQMNFTAGAVTVDKQGNVYVLDNGATLRKYSKSGSLLAQVTPPGSGVSDHLEFANVAGGRIVQVGQNRLIVYDTSLNVLYNQPIPNVGTWYYNFVIRRGALYHIALNGALNRRMQKFNLSTLMWEFDNFQNTGINPIGPSIVEVDSSDNFYYVDSQYILRKIDKFGVQVWSVQLSDPPAYCYLDEREGRLYFSTGQNRRGYVSVTNGDQFYTVSTGTVGGASMFVPARKGRNPAKENGISLVKHGSPYNSLLAFMYKDSVQQTSGSMDNVLIGVDGGYHIADADTNAGVTALIFSGYGVVYILNTGVKIL